MSNRFSNNYNNELIKQVLDIAEAKEIQVKFSSLLKKRDFEKLSLKSWKSIDKITAIDVSYFFKNDIEYGIACAILWDFNENKLIETQFYEDEIKFPYIPGYLGFREVPIMVNAFNKLTSKPNVILCDGHGMIHPRRFGEATHLGLALNIPSIGIAKNPFIGQSNWKSIERNKGNKRSIINNDELLGYAVCLANNRKPVFISTGYMIDIELALKVALYLTKNHRQPEPLFLADQKSRQELSRMKK